MKKKQKNMKINQSINIIESITLLLLIAISFIIYNGSFLLPTIVKALIIGLSLILIAVIISIELFCLMLESNKYRIYSIIYYISVLAILLVINNFIPFFAIISALVLNVIKNLYRIKNISTIYEYDKFAAYCKIYGIKTRKPRATKKTTTTKKVSTVAVKEKTKAKAPAKNTSKSYA